MMSKNIIDIALINDTSLNRHFGCHFLMLEMNKLLDINNFSVKNRIFNADLNILDEVKKIKSENINLAIINGEGTLHGQTNRKVNEILQSAKYINTKLNKKVFLINATVADLEEQQLYYFKYFEKIYVREYSSFKYLSDNNISSEIVPDLLTNINLNINYKKKNNKIIFNDSSFENLKFDLKNKQDIVNVDIRYFNRVEYTLLRIYLRLKYFNIIYKYLQFVKNLNAQKFLKKISGARFVITGRFHAMLICFSLKIPFFGYKTVSNKIEGVLRDSNLENRYKTVDELNILDYRNYQFTQDEIKKIELYKENGSVKIKKMFSDIRKIISG